MNIPEEFDFGSNSATSSRMLHVSSLRQSCRRRLNQTVKRGGEGLLNKKETWLKEKTIRNRIGKKNILWKDWKDNKYFEHCSCSWRVRAAYAAGSAAIGAI